MQNVIVISQVVISIILMILILTQNKDGGLSAVMGGGSNFEAVRRGPEKVIFRATIVFGVLFLLNALAFLFV